MAEVVDIHVDLAALTRVAGELRAAVGRFADIGRPAAIRAGAHELGGSEVSDAVAEFGLRWQMRVDSLRQDLSDSATQAQLAVDSYAETEADLTLQCTDGPSTARPAGHGSHGASGSW